MSWFYLLIAGSAEIFFAATIPKTEGFSRFWPTMFCMVFIAASMYLLSLATKTLPLGTAYAVWVGIGAIGTATYGMIVLGEDRSPQRILCFALILAGIIGLKLLSSGSRA